MEIKKSEKADLESKKGLFLQIGLVIALASLLFAFEYKSYDLAKPDLNNGVKVLVEEDHVLPTEQNTPPPPPPPAPEIISPEIEIVDDETEITNDVEINAEADEKTHVEVYVAPVVVEEVVEEEEIFQIVEEMPSYPGGDRARLDYMNRNLKYPILAQESGIQGTVHIAFVVEKNGEVTDVRILRGIGGGCDEEAVRVVKAMPKWNPGKQRNKAVRVAYSVPVRFSLGN